MISPPTCGSPHWGVSSPPTCLDGFLFFSLIYLIVEEFYASVQGLRESSCNFGVPVGGEVSSGSSYSPILIPPPTF